MNERMKGFLGMLGKNLGITEAVNPQARMQTGEALPTGQDQFNIARERADIPSPRADFADKSRIAKNTGFGLTQSMMRDFDPSDNEQVLQMQKAMNAAGQKAFQLVEKYIPSVADFHKERIEERVPKKWRFAKYFTSTISNCNISAPVHQDHANVKGGVNIIITKRRNSKGGNLHVPDYGATFEQTDNSMLVYPAWRNMHGVTPIIPTYQKGYRNSHVWYVLDSFANLD